MLKLSFRKKSKIIGKQSVHHEKNHNWSLWSYYNNNVTSYESISSILESLLPQNIRANYGQPWNLIERFCELNIGKSTEDLRTYRSRNNSLLPVTAIGMSSRFALTDEDEYTLEFGSEEEKEKIRKFIKFSAKYTKKPKEKWEDYIKEENVYDY